MESCVGLEGPQSNLEVDPALSISPWRLLIREGNAKHARSETVPPISCLIQQMNGHLYLEEAKCFS